MFIPPVEMNGEQKSKFVLRYVLMAGRSGIARDTAGIFKADPEQNDFLQAAWLWCFGTVCRQLINGFVSLIRLSMYDQ